MPARARTAGMIPVAAEHELFNGRIVDAIKVVQSAQNVCFREAKRMVEERIASDPALKHVWEQRRDRARRSLRPWVSWLGAITGALVALALLKWLA